MDKAAIAISIAITAIGVGIAFSGAALPTTSTVPSAAQSDIATVPIEPADTMMEDTMMEDAMEDKMMEDTMEDKMMEDTMEDKMMEDTMEDKMMEDTMMEDKMTNDGPVTHTVEVPVGSAVIGCEETNECYLPADITISVDDTVEWDNIDTAAHTVTAGAVSTGPTGEFDSGLFLAGTQYQVTFEEEGEYEYFCIVHPWMAGTVTVN